MCLKKSRPVHHKPQMPSIPVGRDSVDGTVTHYGLDSPGIESR